MKKKISVLLAAAMVLGLAGCAGSGQKAVQTPAATEAKQEEAKKEESAKAEEKPEEKGDDRIEVGRRRSGGHGGVRSQ